MFTSPWIRRELAATRIIELEREADAYRLAQLARGSSMTSPRPSSESRRAGTEALLRALRVTVRADADPRRS